MWSYKSLKVSSFHHTFLKRPDVILVGQFSDEILLVISFAIAVVLYPCKSDFVDLMILGYIWSC